MFILDMIEIDRDLLNARANLATDCKKKIITCKPLFNVDSEPTSGQVVRQVIVNDFEPGNRGEPKQRITLEVVFIKKHSLDGLNSLVEGLDERYEDVGTKEALNIVVAKGMLDDGGSYTQEVAAGTPSRNDVFQADDNRVYFRPGHEELAKSGKGLLAIRGCFSSMSPGYASGPDFACSLFWMRYLIFAIKISRMSNCLSARRIHSTVGAKGNARNGVPAIRGTRTLMTRCFGCENSKLGISSSTWLPAPLYLICCCFPRRPSSAGCHSAFVSICCGRLPWEILARNGQTHYHKNSAITSMFIIRLPLCRTFEPRRKLCAGVSL